MVMAVDTTAEADTMAADTTAAEGITRAAGIMVDNMRADIMVVRTAAGTMPVADIMPVDIMPEAAIGAGGLTVARAATDRTLPIGISAMDRRATIAS